MNKIFLCGDLHQDFYPIEAFLERINYQIDCSDKIIILGDFCANYFCNGDAREEYFKKKINSIGCEFLIIRGNHEERVSNLISNDWELHIKNSYSLSPISQKENYSYYIEKKYPNICYLPDEPSIIYLNGYRFLILPGAYSVDKFYRIKKHLKWFKDEQMTEEEMNQVRNFIAENNKFDFILSHTCPSSLVPKDLFIKDVDQSLVDNSMEDFFEEVRQKTSYKAWVWGHFHEYRYYGLDEQGRQHLMLFNDSLIELNDLIGNKKILLTKN